MRRLILEVFRLEISFKKVLSLRCDTVIGVSALLCLDTNQSVIHELTQSLTRVTTTETGVSRNIARSQLEGLGRPEELEDRLISGFHPIDPPVHTGLSRGMRCKLCSVPDRLLRFRLSQITNSSVNYKWWHRYISEQIDTALLGAFDSPENGSTPELAPRAPCRSMGDRDMANESLPQKHSRNKSGRYSFPTDCPSCGSLIVGIETSGPTNQRAIPCGHSVRRIQAMEQDQSSPRVESPAGRVGPDPVEPNERNDPSGSEGSR